MTPTKLIYLEQMQQLTCSSQVVATEQQEKAVVYLDQTVFYPQGGGQPFDTGAITSGANTFIVDEVRYVEGAVAHKGHFAAGTFAQGSAVECVVDATRRLLNSRLHTAGHVIDLAVDALALPWEPTKAYHFPDSPYVEYEGELDSETLTQLQQDIQRLCDDYVQKNLPVSCRFATTEELPKLCKSVPTNFWGLDPSKPIRIVLIDTFGVPCGGTHIKSLSDIISMTITKIKKKGTTIRVGYDVIRQ